jgi:predicted nucleotidyltransferase
MSTIASLTTDWDVTAFCREHGIDRLALFGSAARDELTPESDVDVLVHLDRDRKPSIYDLVRIRAALEERFGRPVDLIEEQGLRNPFRRREIMRTRRTLYDAG